MRNDGRRGGKEEEMWERDEGREERRRDGREKRRMKEGIKGDDRKGGRERERVGIEDHKGAGERGGERGKKILTVSGSLKNIFCPRLTEEFL